MKITRKQLRKMILEASQPEEKEKIVDQIINKLFAAGVVSRDPKRKGLIDLVDNYDEFEDLIRYIINATGLPNNHNQLYAVLKKVAEDFRASPDEAADMSIFNIG